LYFNLGVKKRRGVNTNILRQDTLKPLMLYVKADLNRSVKLFVEAIFLGSFQC